MKKSIGLSTILLMSAPLLFAVSNSTPEDVIKTGQHSTKLLITTLGKNMKKNLKSGGALQALDFCSKEAYTLTQNVNKKLPKGVSVKRVSLQNRSPLNVPSNDEKKVLQNLHKLQQENKKLPPYVVKQIDKHTYKFYKPLIINKPVCLQCHGNITNELLDSEISSRYPHDKATGYKMGDLRGAVVTIIHK